MPNALAAAALARELGLGLDGIADGLGAAVARSRWRMEVRQRADGVTVINDAYNANPESVRAALDALAHLAQGSRGFAVLGHMAELGGTSRSSHEDIGEYAARVSDSGLAGLIAVGEEAAPLLAGARRVRSWPGEALAAPDGAAALELLANRLKPARRRTGKGIPRRAPGRCRRCSAGGGRPVKTVLLSAAVSMFIALFGTPLAIKTFSRRGYGQEIRSDGPAGHLSKRGTPTMGGTVIIIASLAGYLIGHLVTGNAMSASGLLVLFLMTGLGLVGFADDFIKLYMQRSLGLRSGAKLAGQAIVGVVFALLAIRFPDGYDLTPASTHLSFYADFGVSIGPVLFVVWVILMVAGTSNGVNLTDGLDGLATGAAILVLAAYMIIGIWQLRNDCTVFLAQACYAVRDPQDLAIVAATVMGACAGFLWWNAPPAKIFMGDTGSLALGGAIAGLAITTRTELLLFLLGGLFVIITLSVVIQVGSFKLTGKRVFRMAPLQHHFELAGWAETTIVVRFWIIAGICVALGLGIFYVG